jgi:simple sugar transport system permease protein
MKLSVKIEPRLETSRKLGIAIPVFSLASALLSGAVFLFFMGVSPLQAYSTILRSSLGDAYGLSETIVKAIPLAMAAIAVMLSFTMLIWNIGAEGQIFMGAMATAAAVRYLFVDNHAVMFLIMFTAAGIAGGVWGAVAGYLRARWSVNEIITTLMLNYVAMNLLNYFVYGPWRDPASLGFPMTAPFPDAARLPSFWNTRIHAGLFLALLLPLVFWIVLRFTRWGYEIRVMGENPKAAGFAGMSYLKNVVLVMFLSGAIAGIAGMCELSGLQGRLQHGFSGGYGYTAIIVAWLARLHPIAILLVSFLMGILLVGGETLQIVMRLPLSSMLVLQGLILFFVLGGEFFRKFRIRIFFRGVPNPQPTISEKEGN